MLKKRTLKQLFKAGELDEIAVEQAASRVTHGYRDNGTGRSVLIFHREEAGPNLRAGWGYAAYDDKRLNKKGERASLFIASGLSTEEEAVAFGQLLGNVEFPVKNTREAAWYVTVTRFHKNRDERRILLADMLSSHHIDQVGHAVCLAAWRSEEEALAAAEACFAATKLLGLRMKAYDIRGDTVGELRNICSRLMDCSEIRPQLALKNLKTPEVAFVLRALDMPVAVAPVPFPEIEGFLTPCANFFSVLEWAKAVASKTLTEIVLDGVELRPASRVLAEALGIVGAPIPSASANLDGGLCDCGKPSSLECVQCGQQVCLACLKKGRCAVCRGE